MTTYHSAIAVDEIAAVEARNQSRARLTRIFVRVALLALVVLIAAIYVNRWWTIGRFHEVTDDAYIGGDLTVIGSRVPGYIVELLVTDNQFVHAGDRLLRIDDRDYRASLAKATGAVNAQHANLANLVASTALQQANIAQARAGIAAASAEAEGAQNDFERYRDLVGRSAVSIESAQRSEALFKSALARVDQAKAQLQAALLQLDVIATQKQQVAAALEQARADEELAQIDLDHTDIRAPIDGYVGNRRARVGMYAAAGNALLSVVPAHGLWVDANFKEDQLSRMKAGQAVTIHADAMPDKTLHGHLVSLSPATGAQFSILPPENATGNFTKIVQRVPVRIRLDEGDSRLGELRPGLSVIAEVDTRDPVAALVANEVAHVSPQ